MNIKFTINTKKAIEAIVWIIQRGESNIYNAMKIFFAADKYHINMGRPVTGDRYVAMPFGTVPVWIYATVKNPKPGIGFTKDGNNLVLDPGRTCDTDYLSVSDIEALEHGFIEYAGKSFAAVREKNHQEPAWINAVNRNPGSKAPTILFEDMIDGKEWLVDDLKVWGKYLCL